MKKQRNFIYAVASILVLAIALLAFSSSSVSNDAATDQSEFVMDKGDKADIHDAAFSYDGCGDGKCGDDKKEKKKDKKKKKDGKCGDGDGKDKKEGKKEEKKTEGEE